MKIIIAGAGKVGAMLAGQLSAEGYELTLIDTNKQVLDGIIEKYDVLAVNGNCATAGALRQAGVEDARLLITTAGADEVNLLCCMTAHTINPKIHTIARIRNPEYSEHIYNMRDMFALSMAVNPERQAATEIERLLEYPGFLKREAFAKDRVEIVELKISETSKLNGVSLSDLNSIVKCRVLVCVVLRDGAAIMPDGSFVIMAGDRIFVTAPTNELATLLKNLGIITRKVGRVILAGGGMVSFYLAQRLIKSGVNVKIIEKDYSRCVTLAEQLPAADVVCGDASNQEFLESEGVSKCDAVVSLTGLDEMNIVISLYATERGMPHVVTKLAHLENTGLLERLPIGSIVSPKELCCNVIVRYVRAMRNKSGAAVSVHSIAAGQAEAAEFRVDEKTKHCGVPLRDLRLRKNVLIVGISRRGVTVIPNGDSSFNRGDTVVVVSGSETVLLSLNDIFE